MSTLTERPPAAAGSRLHAAALHSPAAQVVGLAALLALGPLLLLRGPVIADPDLWFHLRTGDWVLQHHSVPLVESFSSYMVGKPWVAYSWLFEALLALLFRWFDLIGIVMYGLVMRLLLTATMWRLVSGALPLFWRALAVAAVAVYVCGVTTGPRPALFSMVFVIIVLDTVLRAERSRSSTGLWVLPLAFVVWASVHIEFVYGLAVLGAFAVEPLVMRLWAHICPFDFAQGRLPRADVGHQGYLWTLLAACTAATLINPYGVGVWKLIWSFSRQPKLYQLISEMQAPNFRFPAHFVAVGMALAAAFALGRRRPLRPLWVMLLALATAQGLRSARELWFMTVIAAVVIAAEWTRAEAPVVNPHLPKAGGCRGQKMAVRQRLAAVVCALALIAAGTRYYNLNNDFLWMNVHGNFPEAAARYAESHHLHGRLFNDYGWGGFLMWRLPGMTVSIDGRSNVHDQEHAARALNTWRGKPDWQNDPDLVAADVVIGRADAPLSALLRQDRRFRLVHEDHEAVVFEAVP